jgi:hypothetical protein
MGGGEPGGVQSDLVGDHAAPGPARRAESVGGQFPLSGGGALGGEAAGAAMADAAGHRPGHHDGLPDLDVPYAVTDGHDLGDALVTDPERPSKGDVAADRRDDRIDEAEGDACLEGAGDGPVDRQGVAVTASGQERPDDGIDWLGERGGRAFPPGEPAAAYEGQLPDRVRAHPVPRMLGNRTWTFRGEVVQF